MDDCTVEDEIDVSTINQQEAISGYYKSLDEVKEMYADKANMIIAECYFETFCCQ